MRKVFYELLALALIGGSLAFFVHAVGYLSRRDYASAVLVSFIGLAVISVGKEMARLALAQKE